MTFRKRPLHSAVLLPAAVLALVIVDTLGVPTILYHAIFKGQSALAFSFDACDEERGYGGRISTREWVDNRLVVTGIVTPNCSSTWLFGSYILEGDRLELHYHPVQSAHEAAACECPRRATYELEGLPPGDYEIALLQGETIEYTPLISRLIP